MESTRAAEGGGSHGARPEPRRAALREAIAALIEGEVRQAREQTEKELSEARKEISCLKSKQVLIESEVRQAREDFLSLKLQSARKK